MAAVKEMLGEPDKREQREGMRGQAVEEWHYAPFGDGQFRLHIVFVDGWHTSVVGFVAIGWIGTRQMVYFIFFTRSPGDANRISPSRNVSTSNAPSSKPMISPDKLSFFISAIMA